MDTGKRVLLAHIIECGLPFSCVVSRLASASGTPELTNLKVAVKVTPIIGPAVPNAMKSRGASLERLACLHLRSGLKHRRKF